MTEFVVTCAAMLQILVAVIAGAIACRNIPSVGATLRDFSYLISRVLVPCLISSHMISSLTVKILLDSIVLVVFSALGIVVGSACSTIVNKLLFSSGDGHTTTATTTADRDAAVLRKWGVKIAAVTEGRRKKIRVDVPKSCPLQDFEIAAMLRAPSKIHEELTQYRTMCRIACSVQNTVVVPLSLITPIAGSVPWINLPAAVTYVFVYNIVVTMFFWGVGTYIVWEAAADVQVLREKRELLEKFEKLVSVYVDASTQTLHESDLALAILQARKGSSSSGRQLHVSSSSFTGSPAANYFGSSPPAQFSAIELNHSVSSLADMLQQKPRETSLATSAPAVITHALLASSDDMAPAAVLLPVHRYRFDWFAARMLDVVRIDGDDAVLAGTASATSISVADSLGRLKRRGGRVVLRIRRTLQSFANPPFIATIVGLAIGLLPFKEALFSSGPLRVVLDSMIIIGTGCVPASLLLLGANLSGLSGGSITSDVRLRHAGSQAADERLEDENSNPLFFSLVSAEPSFLLADVQIGAAVSVRQEPPPTVPSGQPAMMSPTTTTLLAAASEAVPRAASSSRNWGDIARIKLDTVIGGTTLLTSIAAAVNYGSSLLNISGVVKPNIIIAVVCLRSIAIPGVSFLLIHACVVLRIFPAISDPYHNTLLLILFLEVAAPTAINAALLFSMRQFSTKPFAKLLFYLYLNALWSVVLWMSIAMWYIS